MIGGPDHRPLWERPAAIKTRLMTCRGAHRGQRLETRRPIRSLFEVLIVWTRERGIERKGQSGDIKRKHLQESDKLVIRYYFYLVIP